MTSATPWFPTDLIASSAIASAKRCVVIFPNGKRAEAILRDASSQAGSYGRGRF